MSKYIKYSTIFSLIFISTIFNNSYSSDFLPLISLKDFTYNGAFRVRPPSGEAFIDYTKGVIDFNKENNSIYLISRRGGISEYPIPDLSMSENIQDLNVQSAYLQPDRFLFDRDSAINPSGLNTINGIKRISNKIFMNAILAYDGNGQTKDTTIILDGAQNLATATLSNFHQLQGAAHTAGWISEIPEPWKTSFGHSHITGHASNESINSRLSIGPTAFLVNFDHFDGNSIAIPTIPLLDFSLSNYLYKTDIADGSANWEEYGYNIEYIADGSTAPKRDVNGNVITIGNDLWTEVATASYGFIIPGTSTYAVFGRIAGIDGGIGYKITQDDGINCGGPCPYLSKDYHNYYWLWDVNDFLKVFDGHKLPHELRPYEYGKFVTPFQKNKDDGTYKNFPISSGTFDRLNSILYLSYQDADQRPVYDRHPVFITYKIEITSPKPPTDLVIQ
jgi:hypothetical protein